MIRKKVPVERNIIDLDGPHGNAYVLLGRAQRFMRELGWVDAVQEAVLKEMKSGDYAHLLRTFELEFGGFCILETDQPDLLKMLGR